MYKRLLVLMIAWCLLGWPCVAKNKGSSSHAADNIAHSKADPVKPSSTVVDPPSSTLCSQNQPCYTKDSTAETLPPHWRRPEWVIVYVTVFYVVIAGLTLWAIKKQADTMAAQLAFQRESLRPRLSVSDFMNDTFDEARRGGWVFVYMKIANSGAMPAYKVEIDTWIEFVHGVPPYRISPQAKYARAAPITVSTGDTTQFNIPLHRKLTGEERDLMVNAKGAICFRLKMHYTAFTDAVYTEHGFVVRPKEFQDIPEYSSAT